MKSSVKTLSATEKASDRYDDVSVIAEGPRDRKPPSTETNTRVELKLFCDSSGGGRRLIHIQRSFIFSWHMCYYRQEISSSWRLLTPAGMRASLPPFSASSTLNDVIWPRLELLHRAKLISTPINAELKRGFKYLTAAVNNMQWITLEVCVFFTTLSPW